MFECAGWRKGWFPLWQMAAVAMAGCAAYPPPLPLSQNHIQAEPANRASGIPAPVGTSALVPPPQPSARPQTYSVVVNEVPVKQLLFALARDSALNVDVHPAIQGVVTMNAVNESLDAILLRLSRQVSLRYRIEGNTLVIAPDTPYLHTYRVDYVNLSRDMTTSIGVTSQIAGLGSTSASGSGVQEADGNTSSTAVKSASNNSFWLTVGENIRHILGATQSVASNAEEKSARVEAVRAESENRMRQAEAVARAGSGAPALFTNVFGTSKLSLAGDIKEQVIVNPAAGLVSVLGNERQHQQVKEYLDHVVNAAHRQVLIEATIVEVALGDQYRAGVDWTKLASTGVATQAMLGGRLGTAPFFTLTYANPDSKIGNIAATVSLLEQFGDTRVLSSPKIMALNNQPALLKVVDDLVYFNVTVTPATYKDGVLASPAVYTTVKQTTPVGIILSVTPQINENGMVSLIIRPSISRLVGYKNDPNPELAKVNTLNPVPEIQVREMESVLQVRTGQTIIMGGLMQDDVSKKRDGLPFVSRIPGLGDVFSYRDDNSKKTELLIFLRPTVVKNASLDGEELSAFRRFLPESSALAGKP